MAPSKEEMSPLNRQAFGAAFLPLLSSQEPVPEMCARWRKCGFCGSWERTLKERRREDTHLYKATPLPLSTPPNKLSRVKGRKEPCKVVSGEEVRKMALPSWLT